MMMQRFVVNLYHSPSFLYLLGLCWPGLCYPVSRTRRVRARALVRFVVRLPRSHAFALSSKSFFASSSACAEDSICQSTIGVSAGGSHSLFLFGNGEIFGCGDNRYMQLGTAAAQVSSATSTLATVESPRRVPWMCPHMPIFVECGWQFSAALTHGKRKCLRRFHQVRPAGSPSCTWLQETG